MNSTNKIMKVAFSDSKSYDIESFTKAIKENGLEGQIEPIFVQGKLNATTVDSFPKDVMAVCSFVNDKIDEAVLKVLKQSGIELVLVRCAGFDMVDAAAAEKLNISVARVPGYSPNAVAEFAIALAMTLNRKVHKAYNRVRDNNFTLSGLVGFDLYKKTVGIIGTGKIGQCFASIAAGFGCKILAYDVFVSQQLLDTVPNVTYVTLEELLKNSDLVSVHAPLTKETTYMINEKTLSMMKPNCILVNTSRGKLIDTKALLSALLEKKIAGAAMDVYENEQKYFFNDLSNEIMDDEILARLQNMPNVLITSHQAFLTQEALTAIANISLTNLMEFASGKKMGQLTNAVKST